MRQSAYTPQHVSLSRPFRRQENLQLETKVEIPAGTMVISSVIRILGIGEKIGLIGDLLDGSYMSREALQKRPSLF